MPLESALNTVTSQTGVLLLRCVQDSAGTADSANITPANAIAIGGIAADTTPQLGGDLDAQGNNIENLGAVEYDVNTVGTSGATETLDTSAYIVHDITMDQACTFTFSNPAPSGDCTTFMLILRGAFTPTFPAAVDWGDASAPTYSSPSIYIFTSVDAGTTWLGSQVGKAFG